MQGAAAGTCGHIQHLWAISLATMCGEGLEEGDGHLEGGVRSCSSCPTGDRALDRVTAGQTESAEGGPPWGLGPESGRWKQAKEAPSALGAPVGFLPEKWSLGEQVQRQGAVWQGHSRGEVSWGHPGGGGAQAEAAVPQGAWPTPGVCV